MAALFMTPEELADLTGRTSSAGQRKWLDANGYRFAVSANNRPIVAREYVLSRLGVVTVEPSGATGQRPNFAALRTA